MRLKQQGKSEADLVNNFIPYLICNKLKSNDEEEIIKSGLSGKAYHPDELLSSKGQLEIDIDWYITQQLFPPIQRLIEHIDGISMDFIAQCFGIDAKKHRYTAEIGNGEDKDEAIPSAILKTETQKCLKDRAIAKLKLKCIQCGETSEFNGVYQTDKEKTSGMLCPQKIKSASGEMVPCNKQYPEKFIKNRVTLFLRQLLEFYYDGTYVCTEPSCMTKTRQLLYEGRCVNVGCKGRVMANKFSERTTNDTLRYL